MNDNHQKLMLTRDDASYVQQSVLEAADSKIKTHMPPQLKFEGESLELMTDPMRSHVEELVHHFITESFEMARYGLIVDGKEIREDSSLMDILNKTPIDDLMVPFDAELNDNLRKLYSLVDDLNLEISNLRRQIPHHIVETVKHDVTRNLENVKYLDFKLPSSIKNLHQLENQISQSQIEYYNLLQSLKILKRETVPQACLEVEKLLKTLDFFEYHNM